VVLYLFKSNYIRDIADRANKMMATKGLFVKVNFSMEEVVLFDTVTQKIKPQIVFFKKKVKKSKMPMILPKSKCLLSGSTDFDFVRSQDKRKLFFHTQKKKKQKKTNCTRRGLI